MSMERLKEVIINTVNPSGRSDRPHRDGSHPGHDQRRHDTRTENQHRQSRPPSDEPMTPEDLREKIQLLERENARLSEELRNERGQAEKLHSQRDIQLESLKEFLDTHDKSGVAEVISEIDLLNDKVDQFASDVSDMLQPPETAFDKEREPNPEKGRTPASFRLIDTLGDSLVKTLESCDPLHNGTQVLLQYTTQAAVLHEIAQLCDIHFSGRFGDGDTPLSRVFNDLASRVQTKEIQPIYARWRALTHRHLRAAVPPEAVQEQSDKFIDDLSRIIIDIYDTIYAITSSVEARTTFRTTFVSALRDLYDSASRFSVMIREDVITTDYTVVSPTPSTDFTRQSMEYPYDFSHHHRRRDTVICTIKFGLMSRGKPGRERVQIEEKLVKKPKVFTLFILEDIFPQQNKTRSA